MTEQIGVCSFYALNGKHCVVSSRCIVCQAEVPSELKKGDKITFKNFGDLDGDYKIEDIKNGVLRLGYLKGGQ